MRSWQLGAACTWTLLIVAAGLAPAQGAEPPAVKRTSAFDVVAASSADVSTTLREFDEWAVVQKTYDAAQIKQMRARFVAKAAQLSGSELQDLLYTVNQKLHILMSAEAKDARDWFSRTLAVASDSYAKELEAKLPDVTKLTPTELQEQLDEFEGRRSSFKQYRTGFDKTREAQVKSIQEENRRQEQALERDRAQLNSAGYSGYSPSFAPRQYVRPSTVRPFGDTFFYSGYRW